MWSHIYNGILAIRKNEIMPIAAKWVDLDMIILSEVSQRKTNNIRYHLCVESKKKKWYKWTYSQKRNKLTDYKNQTYGYQRGKVRVGDKFGSLGLTDTYYIWNR